MNLALGPDEWFRCVIVGGDEVANVTGEVCEALERSALERLAGKDREPDFDLVQPRCVCRSVVQMDVRVARQPDVTFRLVGGQIVENDMDLLALMLLDHAVHEVEELQPSAALVMPARHLS